MHFPLQFYVGIAAFYRATILGNPQHGHTSVAYKFQPRNIYFFLLRSILTGFRDHSDSRREFLIRYLTIQLIYVQKSKEELQAVSQAEQRAKETYLE